MPDFEARSSASFISSKEGRDAALLDPLVDEHQKFVLLARQHRRLAQRLPDFVYRAESACEQITNTWRCSVSVPG